VIYIEEYVFGTLLAQNDNDNERVYFVIEPQLYRFQRQMYLYDWKIMREECSMFKRLDGYKVTLERNYKDADN
jgi:hypothetical protein